MSLMETGSSEKADWIIKKVIRHKSNTATYDALDGPFMCITQNFI
jgi:hypothetical protein